jgi:hypothetical protein
MIGMLVEPAEPVRMGFLREPWPNAIAFVDEK